MIKFLVPVDGSEFADRAVKYLIKMAQCQQPAEIHLVNVRKSIDAWEVRRFLKEHEIAEAQQSEGESDMQSARALLDEAKMDYKAHVLVGPVAPTIAKLAEDLGCDTIVMGTHGRGELANLVIGSVAAKLIHLVKIPITLVK
ncbi:UspA domain-containing protein [Thiorhodococcus drewsii AZ1]|uniref:UspA domain-containing protein n=1 Tax=Thiorhodococcus drewsii AZ1 TaxID=765913 RepID=G2E216_9GAMM|nr:universal stress protein [Thiorhodococcus drewsii]EGV30965.1 UspA domain-containing protein [Thiorhodococcus drewsii AZ1]